MTKYTIKVWTKNGDKMVINTSDENKRRELERSPFISTSNISSAHTTVNY